VDNPYEGKSLGVSFLEVGFDYGLGIARRHAVEVEDIGDGDLDRLILVPEFFVGIPIHTSDNIEETIPNVRSYAFMMKLTLLLLASVVLPAWTAEPAKDAKSLDQMVRNAVAKFREFNSDGKVRSTSTVVSKAEPREGLIVTRVVERDGKPIDKAEQDRQNAAIEKALTEFRNLSPEQLKAKREEIKQKQIASNAFIGELPDAMEFKYVGEETINGRKAVVLNATPRLGYQPRNMRARVFEKTNAKLWIDQAENEMIKAEGEVFDTVNIGFGIIGRVEKGTRFHIERWKIDDRSWAMTYQKMRFAARVMLVKGMNQEMESRFTDYKRYPATASR
jgi:hypothetical protein